MRSTRRIVEHAPVVRPGRSARCTQCTYLSGVRARALTVCLRSELPVAEELRDVRARRDHLAGIARDPREPRSIDMKIHEGVLYDRFAYPPLVLTRCTYHPLNLKPLRNVQGTSFGDERSSRTVIFTRTRANCNRTHVAISTSVIVRSIILSGDINTRYSTEKNIASATAPRIWNIVSLYTRT